VQGFALPIYFQQEVSSNNDNEVMSAKNGDKSRHGRMEKQKRARRVKIQEMRKALATPQAASAEPKQ
jgi:hypothetical protein